MNHARTALLLGAITGLFLLVGYLIGGGGGMLIAFLVAAAMNGYAYWNADKIVLRMYRAHPVTKAEAPDFVGLIEQLSRQAGMPMPAVYVIDNPQPNAFATGRDPEHAAVAATTGLLQLLTPEEVAGVMAHELAHVRNRDTLTSTLAATIAGAISMLANFAFFIRDDRENPLGTIGVVLTMLLAPIAAMLIQMAVSRTREYEADREGAQLCGRPLWLASALAKIDQAAHRIENREAGRNPATAHLFIINPLRGGALGGLFSTHPSTEDRVARLRAMAGQMGTAQWAPAQTTSRTATRQGPWGGGPWG